MGLVTSDDICFVLLNLLFYDNEGNAVTYNFTHCIKSQVTFYAVSKVVLGRGVLNIFVL